MLQSICLHDHAIGETAAEIFSSGIKMNKSNAQLTLTFVISKI